jgi:hypothetical protein
VVEATVTDADDRSRAMALAAGNGTPWRISVRGWNATGLSPGRSAILAEGDPNAPPPHNCLADFPAPTLVSAHAAGRVVTIQWNPDARCMMTGFLLAASYTPDGPIIGTVGVPYPNGRSWSGAVPPGSYYVRVFAMYHGSPSAPSGSMLVHVQ